MQEICEEVEIYDLSMDFSTYCEKPVLVKLHFF